MSLKALLTLDLDKQTTSEQRAEFYASLKSNKWTKIPRLTTTWKANFEDGVVRDTALSITKSDLRAAASASGVTSYDAAVQFGKGNVETI